MGRQDVRRRRRRRRRRRSRGLRRTILGLVMLAVLIAAVILFVRQSHPLLNLRIRASGCPEEIAAVVRNHPEALSFAQDYRKYHEDNSPIDISEELRTAAAEKNTSGGNEATAGNEAAAEKNTSAGPEATAGNEAAAEKNTSAGPEASAGNEASARSNASDGKASSHGEKVNPKGIPLFIQWDRRWAYKIYGGRYLGITGCGPTCLSMILCGMTGNTKYNPYEVAKWADEQGFYLEGEGSDWTLMTDGAKWLGLDPFEIVVDSAELLRQLRAGHPVIASVGPGDFTSEGHFIVMTGADSDGMVTVHDPNSPSNSEKKWNIDRLTKQILAAWGYV